MMKISSIVNVETQLWNCSEFEYPDDENYLSCVRLLSEGANYCDHLKFAHIAFSFPYYFLGLIPLFFSILAFIVNIIFAYISSLIIIDSTNDSRYRYTFLLSRSVSILIAQIMFYIVLIAWKFESFEYISAAVFLILGSLSFSTLAGTYLALSGMLYFRIIHSEWYDRHITMKTCSVCIGIIWLWSVLISVFIGIYGATFIYPEGTTISYSFYSCQKPLAIGITIAIFISYATVIISYIVAIFKFKRKKLAVKKYVRICGSKNVTVLQRLLYNVLIFAVMKFPLLVISVLTVSDLKNLKTLGNGEETTCKKFLHGKLYFRVELLASISILVILIGMITDPLIIIFSELEAIRDRLIDHWELHGKPRLNILSVFWQKRKIKVTKL